MCPNPSACPVLCSFHADGRWSEGKIQRPVTATGANWGLWDWSWLLQDFRSPPPCSGPCEVQWILKGSLGCLYIIFTLDSGFCCTAVIRSLYPSYLGEFQSLNSMLILWYGLGIEKEMFSSKHHLLVEWKGKEITPLWRKPVVWTHLCIPKCSGHHKHFFSLFFLKAN